MGQEILYCSKCNTRVLGAEFEKGTAFQVGNRTSCAACAAELLTTLPPREREQLLAKMFKATQDRGGAPARHGPGATPTPRTHTRLPAQPAPPAPFPTGLAIGIGIGAVLLILVVIAITRGGNREPETAMPAPATPPVKAQPSAREKEAQAAVARARGGPDDPAGQVRLWQEAVWAADGTRFLEEARTELARVLARQKETIEKDFARLEEGVRAAVKAEEFRKAVDLLAEASKRRDDPDWRLRIDRKKAETQELPKGLFPPLQEQAIDAKARGAAAEVKSIQDRVAKWGLDDYRTALEKALAAVGPAGSYRPTGDLICVEAENFHAKVDRDTHAWSVVAAPAGFQGKGAVATPDLGRALRTGYVGASPRLDYRINFTKTGTYTVWIRGSGAAESDSIHVGLDGAETPSSAHMTTKSGKWHWSNKTQDGPAATIQITTLGMHTLNLWMREDGTIIDRIVLVLDPSWKPPGSGPPESPR